MLLLDAGTDVNSTDHQSMTPLHQAIIHGNKDAAELLLCYGASVYNAEGVTNTLSALELADHVHVCHHVITSAEGEIFDTLMNYMSWFIQVSHTTIVLELGPSACSMHTYALTRCEASCACVVLV